MTQWSLGQLDRHYTPLLRSRLNQVQEVAGAVPGSVPLEEVYVESPVEDPAATAWPIALAELFPSTHRLLLIAGGGAGKTTLVSHVCRLAAEHRLENSDGPIPLIALVRDIPGSEYDDVLTLLLRTLRHRYALDLTVDALEVALAGGHVFVALDGLDELADPTLRRSVATSIREFADAYPKVPLLVTSRPYLGVESELPGFRGVTIRPWTRRIAVTYLERLASKRPGVSAGAARELVELIDREVLDSNILASPLALQMLIAYHARDHRIPTTYTELLELFIEEAITARERTRGTLYLPAQLLRPVLESAAFAMQSNPTNRTSIAHADLLRVVTQSLSEAGLAENGYSAEEILYRLTTRVGLLRPIDSDSTFGFTHTLFREHLAAVYLSRRAPGEFAGTVTEYAADASWETVFRGALEIRLRREPLFDAEVVDHLRGYADLGKMVTRWGQQFTSRECGTA